MPSKEKINLEVKFYQVKDIDLPHVAKLSKELSEFESKIDKTLNKDWDIQKYLREKIKQNNCFIEIIRISNEDIGYFIVSIKNDEEYRIIDKTIEIEELYLVEKYRNKGVGHKIMDKLQELSKTINLPLKVKVSAMNKQAIKFYHKIGFLDYDLILEKDNG